MEFQFTRNTLMGEYYVKCSMGHEVVGRWLQEEIGKNRHKIEEVDQLIELAKSNPAQELKLLGTEISLSIHDNEVVVEENVLAHEQELEGEFDFYDSEASASCGLDDFELLIERWIDFLGY
ncbi:YacL family protein [Vibrio paucivorans]|uniref:UPF0231 protein MD483_00305 n=1 Tax=Vibrio paucivorans TaxID=2829489 RepID=A0A9X3HNS7_9VIBR|nr:YacL family protein [Vibrio paucivorans]MCW8332274.1 YacL family protein [Vibrio paucivorans]